MQADSHPPPEEFSPRIDDNDYSQDLINWDPQAHYNVTVHIHSDFAILRLGSSMLTFKHNARVDPTPLRNPDTHWGLSGSAHSAITMSGYNEARKWKKRDGGLSTGHMGNPDHIRTVIWETTFQYCTVWHGNWTVVDFLSVNGDGTPLTPEPSVWDNTCTEIELTAVLMKMKVNDSVTKLWEINKSYSASFNANNDTSRNLRISCSVIFKDYNHIALSTSRLTFLDTCQKIGTISLVRKR
jgi:hypothetical protein